MVIGATAEGSDVQFFWYPVQVTPTTTHLIRTPGKSFQFYDSNPQDGILYHFGYSAGIHP